MNYINCIIDFLVLSSSGIGYFYLSVPGLKNTSAGLNCENYGLHSLVWWPLKSPATNGRIPWQGAAATIRVGYDAT